ncbi:D-aminoacyl-tRNA deacylase [Candidatus Micrarchaeota archaeon]|nr:D-aminoacyl-tRNA deacylase [Candidatus Micrarchaeota archaeon]
MNLVVYSAEDACGSNCAKFLLKQGFVERAPIETTNGKKRFWLNIDKTIGVLEASERLSVDGEYLSRLDVVKNAGLIVFPYRHRSSSNPAPVLTAHSTGNFFSSTEKGGNPRQLSRSCAGALKFVRDYFQKSPLRGYEFVFEATHHGPTSLTNPCLFIEIGPSQMQWNDLAACEYVSKLVFSLACTPVSNLRAPSAFIGFGGGHYNGFLKQVDGGKAFSFAASKHVLDELDSSLVKQMAENTLEKPVFAVIDWNGCTGEQRKKIIGLLEEQKIGWEKV